MNTRNTRIPEIGGEGMLFDLAQLGHALAGCDWCAAFTLDEDRVDELAIAGTGKNVREAIVALIADPSQGNGRRQTFSTSAKHPISTQILRKNGLFAVMATRQDNAFGGLAFSEITAPNQRSLSLIRSLVLQLHRLDAAAADRQKLLQINARIEFRQDLRSKLRTINTVDKILQTGLDQIASLVDISRAGFGWIRNDETVDFAGGIGRLATAFSGSMPLETFVGGVTALENAEIVRFPSNRTLSVILRSNNQPDALLYAHSARDTGWSENECLLLSDAAECIWHEAQRAIADEAIRSSEARLRTVLASTSDGFLAIDENWNLTVFNTAAEAFFGRDSASVIGRSLYDILPEARGSLFQEIYARVMARARAEAFETTSIARPDHIVEVRVGPLARGGLAITFSDITARKRNEAELLKRQARLNAIFAQTAAGIVESELRGRFTNANDRFLEMVGRSREELLKLTMEEITHPDDLHDSLHQIDRNVSLGLPVSIIKRYLRSDGSSFPAMVSATIIRSEAAPPSAFAVVVDLSDVSRRIATPRAILADIVKHRSVEHD